MMPDYGHEAADKGLKKLEKDLKSLYLNAAVDMQEKARDFMRDFERKDEQMRALVEEGKWTEEQYNTWRRNQMMTEKRIQDMTDQLAKDLANTDKIAAGIINNTLPSAYAENYNFGTYEIETGTTLNTSFTLYDKKTVENLMKADPKIIPQARVNIPEDERWNRQKLTSAIAQGILQGESIPKIANRLQNVAAMDRNAAIRNARTYTTAAENKGRVDSIARANDMGIPADQEWLATLDDRTRMEHRHLDGQTRPVGEPFEADGYRIMYPGDPDAEPEMIYNCRCTLVSRVRGRIYNDERNDSKLDGMSYEEWKHAKDRRIEPKEEEKQEETPKSYAESLINKEYSPHIRGYKEVEDFWDAEKEYKSRTGNDRTEYLEDLKKPGTLQIETSWSGGENYNDKIPRIEATIADLEKEYPMLATGEHEYSARLKELNVGDYNFIYVFLPEGKDDRRLTEGAAGQVFIINNTQDKSLGEHDRRVVIGFNRGYLYTTVEEDIKEREEAIANGKNLLEIGSSPEITTIHEWGHVTSEHMDNAFINSDETAQEYWEWYQTLTKEEIAAGLSTYATTNRGEFEAECFAELHMPNPRPLALKYKEYLDEVIKKGY